MNAARLKWSAGWTDDDAFTNPTLARKCDITNFYLYFFKINSDFFVFFLLLLLVVILVVLAASAAYKYK